MSTTSERPGGPGVLQYTAARPAVLLPPHPSDEELAFDWTLSERDMAFILTNHRGPENLCRLAVQLCVLRKHGRFLANYMQVSPAVLGYLCRQLDLAPLVAFSGQVRGNTESDYQRDIAQYLGWCPFTAEVHAWLREWIVEQVTQHLYVEDLVEQASAELRTHRIVPYKGRYFYNSGDYGPFGDPCAPQTPSATGRLRRLAAGSALPSRAFPR